MWVFMKSNFPRLVISSEIRRKMVEIARKFRTEPTEIPEKNLLLALNMIRAKIQALKLNQHIPFPHMGEG